MCGVIVCVYASLIVSFICAVNVVRLSECSESVCIVCELGVMGDSCMCVCVSYMLIGDMDVSTVLCVVCVGAVFC